jgi:hypothetical protein
MDDGADTKKTESAVDITEKFILERINPGLAADLVRTVSNPVSKILDVL